MLAVENYTKQQFRTIASGRNERLKYFLYKIYYANSNDAGDTLVYLGRTNQPLKRRLHGHFFKTPMMRALDIRCVSKIEYAEFQTEADMFLFEIYYINKLKPLLNRDDKAEDSLTIELSDVAFHEFHCNLMEKWATEVTHLDLKVAAEQKRKIERVEAR